MHNRKFIYRAALLSVIAVSMMLFPLTTGIYSQSSRAYAGQPFTTVVPPNATFAAPIGTPITVPTPIPTLGPGQYFEQGDGLPRVTRPDLLEEPFGYSEIMGEPGLYLVWSTDDDGKKHYYVLDEENTYFDKIMTAVDADRKKYKDLDENGTKRNFVVDVFVALVSGTVTAFCTGATIGSASGFPATIPLMSAFGACTGVAGKFTYESIKSGIGNWSALEDYNFSKEETRKEIEGYFVQIPYSIQD